MFANNFFVAVKPALIKNYSAGNYEYVSKLFNFSSKAIFLLLYVVIIPIIINTEEILQIWLGTVGDYMVTFVQLSLIYTIILIVSYPITAVVQASGNVKLYHGLVDGFSLLALPIMYILFKLNFSASSAYIVSIVVFGIAHILRLYALKKVSPQFNIHNYLWHFVAPSLLVAFISFLIMYYIKILMPCGWTEVLITSILSILISLILGILIVLSKSDRKMLLNIKTKKSNIIIN